MGGMSAGGAISSAMRMLGVSSALSRIGGPILDKELRVTSRRRFTYVLRSVYLALLAGFIALAWVSSFHGTHGSSLYVAAEMAAAGKVITATLAIFQLSTLPLVAILLLSGSISEEVDRRTLGVLLSTPVSAFQVVTGKLISRLLHLVLLLAAGVPAMVIIRVMGGVPAEYILTSTCITLVTILFCGMLTLYLSIGDRRAWRVTLKAFAVLGVAFLLVPVVCALIASPIVGDSVFNGLSYINPPLTMVRTTWGLLWPSASGGGPPPMPYWYVHCIILAYATVILFAVSVIKVKYMALAQAMGGETTGRSRGRARAGVIRRVYGPPVLWKEIRRRTVRRRVLTVILQVAVLAVLVLMYILVGRELRDRDTQMVFNIVIFIVGVLVTAVLAAPTLTSEKETQTMPILLTTPLSGTEIVFGKAVGVLWRSLVIWGLFVLHLALMTAMGYQSAWTAMHATMLSAGTAVFLVGAGLFFSAVLRKSTSSVVFSLMLPLLGWGVVPAVLAICCEVFAFGRDTMDLILCFDPGVLMGIISVGYRHNDIVDYHWPAAMGRLNMFDSTMVILMIAVTYAAIGVILAVLAADRLRARVRK
jgi:ABC-type transport system involved in multi-copper enzyme maturation permease subunit